MSSMNKRNKNILFLNPVPLIYNGIMWGFKQNGWNTYLMQGEDFVLGKSTNIQIEGISQYVEKYNIDVVFLDFGVGADFKAIYEYCDSKGVKFCIWGIEDTIEFPCWMEQTLPLCHYYFTTTEELIPIAKAKFNRDIDLLLFGTNLDFHKPTTPNKIKYPYDICLAANNYDSRFAKMKWFLNPLLEKEYQVAIYGNDWWVDSNRYFNICKHQDKYKGYIGYGDLPELYSSVPVVLGVNCSDLSLSQVSMRPFEFGGMAYNSCLVSFYTKAQERWFGDLIYLPKNTQETIDMVNEVLCMTDEQRIDKADKLREFCYKYHSYKDRAKIVIDRIS